ncbi:unnamed protein product [Amoebophrya sp. A120]|nr:unnamed protein product [Amoebophrya sp. A120]|eukprot:GSA120T00002334001.1
MAAVEQPEEEIDVVGVDISPNDCALEDPLTIRLRFTHPFAIPNARWRIRFSVDTAKKTKIVEFGETEQVAEYPATVSPDSANEVVWHIENLEMPEKLAKDVLKNVGLLVFSLMRDDDSLLDVNFVTQVSTDPATGGLIRNILSPI